MWDAMGELRPASVIVTSYEDAGIIEKSLAAFARQSLHDFELIIADDGSQTDYAPVLQVWAPRFAHGIQHVWHEKKGFRRARILNRAICVSRFDRIIFLDMDCLPHRDFVRNHVLYLEPGTAVTGRRVNVSRDVIPSPPEILKHGLGLGLPSLLLLWARGKAKVIEHGFVSPVLYESPFTAAMGSNLSVCRSDLEATNGFSEEYAGWGFEDTDLELRLRAHGVRLRNLRNKVIQYHLLHARAGNESQQARSLLQRTITERDVRARIGLAEIQPGDFVSKSYSVSAPPTARA